MKMVRLALASVAVGGLAFALAVDRPQAQPQPPLAATMPSPAPAQEAPQPERPPISVPKQEVTVLDGNTLRVGGTVLRLAGVEAPEYRQQCVRDQRVEPCGEQAAQSLQKIVDLAVKPVECRPEANGRAVCLVDGRDIGEALVLQGRALSRNDRYVEAQEQAKKGKLGLWSSAWVPPDQWRDGHRLPEELAARSRSHMTEKKPEGQP